jgi:hypothetical protein
MSMLHEGDQLPIIKALFLLKRASPGCRSGRAKELESGGSPHVTGS